MSEEIIYKGRLEQEILFNQTVVHDLGNILCNMLLWVGLVKKSIDPKDTKLSTMVGQLQTATEVMNQVLVSISDADRIKTGQVIPKKTRFKIEDIKTYVGQFEPQASQRGVSLQFVSTGISTIFADKDMVFRVIGNLLSNAFRHTPCGGVVTLSCSSHNPESLISVTNDGEEIPTEDTIHLFDCYWQKKKRSGLGLGLYICKGFVEANGGKISVNSQGGRTTFTFTLPTIHQ